MAADAVESDTVNPEFSSIGGIGMTDASSAPTGREAGEQEAQVAPPVTRGTRRPFGSMMQKLAYPKRPGYHRHWFNDNSGRIEYATDEAGYTHVKDPKTGKNVSRVVGTREGGNPITAFLLEIPDEWFNDDMLRYEQENAARDDAMRRGQVTTKEPEDQAKFYPSAQGRGISITTVRR
jgi:hypothetical protein